MPDKYDESDPNEEDLTARRSKRRRERQEFEDDMEEEDYRPSRRRRRDMNDDEEGDATGGLIPYKNAKALIGYYCGVFGLLPVLGLVLGPAAVVLGLLGLRYVNQHPTAKGTGHAVVALVLGGFSMLYHFGVLLFVVAMIVASRNK